MSNPTVDQIAAVIRVWQTTFRTPEELAAEIAALWAGVEGSYVEHRRYLTEAINDNTCADSVMAERLAKAFISVADARIDAKMGAGRITDITHPSPFYEHICKTLDDVVPGWCDNIDVSVDASNAIRNLAAERDALHARAEAAEKKANRAMDNLRTFRDAIGSITRRCIECGGVIAAIGSHHCEQCRVIGGPVSSTPTGAARE